MTKLKTIIKIITHNRKKNYTILQQKYSISVLKLRYMNIFFIKTINVISNFQVREENLTEIVLHQNVVSILSVNLETAAGVPVPLRFPNTFTTNSYYEILSIHLYEPIPAGSYVITVRYLGRINENPIDRGFYRGYYYLNNQLR